MRPWPTSVTRLAAFASLLGLVHGQQGAVEIPFDACSTTTAASGSTRLNLTRVVGVFDQGQLSAGVAGPRLQAGGGVLRLVAFGSVASVGQGYSPSTNFLATIITDASIVSFPTYTNSSALCDAIRTPSTPVTNTTGCPYGPGSIALGVSVPVQHSYGLSAITARVRVLDSGVPASELACFSAHATPFYPSFWPYKVMLWAPIGIAIGYAIVQSLGRLWAAHTFSILDREAMLATSLTAKLSSSGWRERYGPVVWNAMAGSALQTSAALRRFATPGVMDVVWIVQWTAIVGMVAVRWPDFAYPMFARAAWSTLVYNVTLTQSSTQHTSLLGGSAALPSEYSAQLSSTTSPLYIDQALPSVLVALNDVPTGMQSFAVAVGLRPQDLFGCCVVIFLAICAGLIALSAVGFAVARILNAVLPRPRPMARRRASGMTSGGGKESVDADDASTAPSVTEVEHRRQSIQRWWSLRGDDADSSAVSLRSHVALAVGNIVRVLLLFHLPLVAFSVYQLSLARTAATTTSVILAGIAFSVLGLALPLLVVFRVRQLAPDQREERATMLALGSMYALYHDASATYTTMRLVLNVIVGVVVGGGQASGTAQAVIILVVEIGDTLATTLLLPHGEGAAMGPLVFVVSVVRIIIAVLLVVLSPAVNVGSFSATAWLTYVVFTLVGLVLLLYLLVLLVKVVELLVRLIGHVPFDESRRARSGGLAGAIRKWDRSGRRRSGGHRKSDLAGPRPRVQSRLSMHDGGSSINTQTLMLQSNGGARTPGYYSAHTRGNTTEDIDEQGYIMSAWQQTPALSYPGKGYVAPGAYSAVGARSPGSAGQSSFSVVRGGRATDASPYTVLPAAYPPTAAPPRGAGGAYYGHSPRSPSGSSALDYFSGAPIGRPRASSQSAAIEFADVGAVRPPLDPHRRRSSIDLLSSTIPPRSPSLSADPTRPGAPKTSPSGFGIRTLFRRAGARSPADRESGESDSDDTSDDEYDEGARGPGARNRRPSSGLWPFGVWRRRPSKLDAPEEPPPVEETAPAERSFVVQRRPRPGAAVTNTQTDTSAVV